MLKIAGYAFGALFLVLVAFAGALLISPQLRVQGWSFIEHDNAPWPPFEITPGLYYVGSSDIAVYALKTRDGIILIDGGYESTGARVPDNMRKLGLNPADIRIILNTHVAVQLFVERLHLAPQEIGRAHV